MSKAFVRFVVAALVVMSVAFLVQAGAFAGIVDDAQKQLDRGVRLAQEGKQTEASIELQKLLADFSDAATPDPRLKLLRAEAMLGLAESLRQQGKLDDAFATAGALLSDYPQFRSECADATIIRAKVFQAKDQYVNAIAEYKTVLRTYPERITRAELARGRIGECLKKSVSLSASDQADLQAAVAIFEDAKRVDDEINSARKNAKARAEAGDVFTARAQLLALFANPAVQSSHGRLRGVANAQLKARDVENARITLNRFLSVAADEFPPESYRLARLQVYTDLQDYSTVVTEGEDALELYPDALNGCEMRYYVAWAYDCLGDKEKCLAQYTLLISRYDSVNDPDTRSMLATALARSGRLALNAGKRAEAIALFQRAVRECPGTEMAKSAANDLRDLGIGEGQ